MGFFVRGLKSERLLYYLVWLDGKNRKRCLSRCKSEWRRKFLFPNRKGVEAGDPISPLLFNLVGDVFARMLEKAARNDMAKGLVNDFRVGGVV